MKKSVVLALAAALACGAASTAFAANPFSDVPADHWAYDAVAQLAADGVIDGYGDGTYRGQQEITRYEMAQMIARGLAKNNNAAAQAQLDKLAAEFAEELNSLGVRVAALEKKVDNVKFYGEARHTWRRTLVDTDALGIPGTNDTENFSQLRLYADAKVNKNWTAKTAFYYTTKNVDNGGSGADNKIGLDNLHHLSVQGKYGNTTIDLGQFENFEPITEGMLWDDVYTGARVTFGKDLKVSLTAARVNEDYFFDTSTGDLLGITAEYSKKKLGLGAAYYHIRNLDDDYKFITGDDKASIWAVSAQYRFDKNFRLYGTYAQNSSIKSPSLMEAISDGNSDKGYNIQLDYKGAKRDKPGSYGLHIAYKHLGAGVVTNKTTYDYAFADYKGFELGGEVMLDKNIRFDLGYFKGKSIIADDIDREVLFSRVHFFF